MENNQKEYEILKCIENGRDLVRQRDMAEIAGLSLGMVNNILKRLVEKGLVKAKHLNSRNFQYLLTQKGIEELSSRSSAYFKRTIKNVTFFKEAINKLVKEAKARGHEQIILIGDSDLDFIFEHCCNRNEIALVMKEDNHETFAGFVVYSENYTGAAKDGFHLCDIVGVG